MKYIDFGTQTIIFVFTIVSLFAPWAHWSSGILYAQLLLGVWQVISSIISVIVKTPFHRKKRLHLLLSTIYLIALYLLALYAFSNINPKISHVEVVFRIMFTLPAWALAIFYYMLTCKWVFLRKRNRGNFLPNLSF